MTDDLDTLEREPGDQDDAREEEIDEPRGDQPWAKASSGDAEAV